MLHVPINIRAQIPSPTLSPTVEQRNFIPIDTAPIVIEGNEQISPSESPTTMTPPIGSPNLQNNILTDPIDSFQVSSIELPFMHDN